MIDRTAAAVAAAAGDMTWRIKPTACLCFRVRCVFTGGADASDLPLIGHRLICVLYNGGVSVVLIAYCISILAKSDHSCSGH